MALDISPLLHDHNLRPKDLAILAAIYNGQTEDAYNAAAIATAITAVNTVIDAQLTPGTGPSNAIKAAVTAMGVTLNDTFSNILAGIKTQLDTIVAADSTNFPYVDGYCAGTGQYEKRRDAGADPTDNSLRHCQYCDGFGRKATQDIVVVSTPAVETYPI